MLRYKLRTLLILLVIFPPLLAGAWFVYQAELERGAAREQLQRDLRALSVTLQLTLEGNLALAGQEADANQPVKRDVAPKRLEIMASRIESLVVSSTDANFPKRMHPTPLFRYDDETRGYVDGTIWRLGEKGRPLAVVTAELHPRYLGGGSRVVYDFLSLTDRPFTARSPDVAGWSPNGSAVALQPLTDAPPPAARAAMRLTQLKQQARRFSGT